MPLSSGAGGFVGLRYVVDALDYRIVQTSAAGAPVRVEASIALLENPVAGGLLSLITSIAKGRAPAVSSSAPKNPAVRK